MENGNHKGSELNNVKETWDQNERNLHNENTSEGGAITDEEPKTELEQQIKKEATEYDNTNKEDRLLEGERATVSDEAAGDNQGR